MTELDELKHDIAEYVKVSSEMASEIVAQKAEIERLKSQRDRLMQELLWAMGALDSSQFIASMGHFTTVRKIIAEIEAEND